MQPLIHKAQITDLAIHIGRSGLTMGDEAELFVEETGQIGVYANLRKSWFGVLRRRKQVKIGALGPTASAMLANALSREGRLRIRIVGLTPEHLTPSGAAEVYISVWGNADPRLSITPAAAH